MRPMQKSSVSFGLLKSGFFNLFDFAFSFHKIHSMPNAFSLPLSLGRN